MRAALAGLLCLIAAPGLAQVVAYERLHGDVSMRDPVDIVLVGDGWTRDELPRYRTICQRLKDGLLEVTPFKEYASMLRITRGDVVSRDSGMSNEARQIKKDTYFGAMLHARKEDPTLESHFLWFDRKKELTFIPRLYWAGPGSVPTDILVVVSNNEQATYGSSWLPAGPIYITCNPHTIPQALAHELGHAIGNLEDEYPGILPPPTKKELGTLPDLPFANVTMKPDRIGLKWAHWMDRPEVGVFEGGASRARGVWRSGFDCMMNYTCDDRWVPFCSVCRSSTMEKIYAYGDPFNRQVPEKTSYTYQFASSVPTTFQVETLWTDPAHLDVYWSVESSGSVFDAKSLYPGTIKPSARGVTLELRMPLGWKPDRGTTRVTCRAMDLNPLARHRVSGRVLDGVGEVFQASWKFERSR